MICLLYIDDEVNVACSSTAAAAASFELEKISVKIRQCHLLFLCLMAQSTQFGPKLKCATVALLS